MSDVIAAAARLLLDGKLVAFPTETVYGLGAVATNAAAVARIFAAKGRPANNPLICHVADVHAAKRYAADWPAIADRLAAAFWPGPLTIVVRKSPEVAAIATAGGETVGLRVPNHPLALQLLAAVNRPIAAPSANRSTCVSPTTAQHVRDELGDAVDLILDGGPCSVGIESTVIDCTTAVPTVLRPGGVTIEMIGRIIGNVVMPPPNDESATSTPGQRPGPFPAEANPLARSPGQQAIHYAPQTPAFLVDANALASLHAPAASILRCGDDPVAYAARLYAILRAMDAAGHVALYVEAPPDTPPWLAVRDRLQRATRPLPR